MAFSTKDFPDLVFESVDEYNKHLARKKDLIEKKKDTNNKEEQIEAIFIKVDKYVKFSNEDRWCENNSGGDP